MRAELYQLIHGACADQLVRNEALLKAATINVHDLDGHQSRDARIVAFLFDAFPDKLRPEFREPALVAAMMHDREYVPAAEAFAREQLDTLRLPSGQFDSLKAFTNVVIGERRKWASFLHMLSRLNQSSPEESDKVVGGIPFPSSINKGALDPHSELGEKRIREWYEDPAFDPAFGQWTSQQREVAALAVRDHSNGSKYTPLQVPREAQALRLADKLDNVFERIRESMLTSASESDKNNCHRYTNAAIPSYSLQVDRNAKTFTVEYDVDFDRLLSLMHRDAPDFKYDKERFMREFKRAYGQKSMPIATEVVQGLFADQSKGEMYAEDAVFRVVFRFSDGTTEEQRYERSTERPMYS